MLSLWPCEKTLTPWAVLAGQSWRRRVCCSCHSVVLKLLACCLLLVSVVCNCSQACHQSWEPGCASGPKPQQTPCPALGRPFLRSHRFAVPSLRRRLRLLCCAAVWPRCCCWCVRDVAAAKGADVPLSARRSRRLWPLSCTCRASFRIRRAPHRLPSLQIIVQFAAPRLCRQARTPAPQSFL